MIMCMWKEQNGINCSTQLTLASNICVLPHKQKTLTRINKYDELMAEPSFDNMASDHVISYNNEKDVGKWLWFNSPLGRYDI